MNQVKFGVNLGSWPFGLPSPSLVYEFAEKAEEWGLDSLWSGDHIVMHSPILECLTVLSLFAARTQKIRLGTAILLLPLRNPAVVAKAVATLDFLSQGRVTLGIGVGGEIRQEWEACGVRPEERGRRADEGIEILRKLWTQSGASHQGRFWQFQNITMEPKPVQKPCPPIWIGGRSEAALKRAARVGDGWVSYMVTPDRFKDSLTKILAQAQEPGRDMSSFTTAHLLFIYGSADRDQARQTAVLNLTKRYNQPFDTLVDRYAAYGRPEDCIKTIEAFVAAGVRHIIFSPLCDASELLSQLQFYAREIVPHFRAA